MSDEGCNHDWRSSFGDTYCLKCGIEAEDALPPQPKTVFTPADFADECSQCAALASRLVGVEAERDAWKEQRAQGDTDALERELHKIPCRHCGHHVDMWMPAPAEEQEGVTLRVAPEELAVLYRAMAGTFAPQDDALRWPLLKKMAELIAPAPAGEQESDQ